MRTLDFVIGRLSNLETYGYEYEYFCQDQAHPVYHFWVRDQP